MSYVLGIDQSLRHSGICLLPVDNPTAMADYRQLETKSMRGVNRLKYIEKKTRDFLAGRVIRYGAIEGGSFGSKGHLFDLGGVNGIMKIIFYDRNIPFVEPSPPSLKKFLAEHGHSDKEDMINYAASLADNPDLKDAISNDSGGNLADAYGLAFLAKTVYTEEEPESKARRDALESILTAKDRVHNPKPLFHHT